MKKLLLCFAAAAVLFASVSCSGNVPSDGENNSSVEIERDLGGISFVIKTESAESASLVPSSSGNAKSDDVAARYSNVSARFNCRVSASYTEPGTLVSNLATATSISGVYADLIELSAGDIYNLYKGGYLTALQALAEFDLSDGKWGGENLREMMTFGDGNTYGFRSVYWGIPVWSVSDVLFYNEKLISANSLKSPYEYYENGEWNWSAFEDICVAVTKDVSDAQGVYGFMRPSTAYPALIHAAIYSNGGKRLASTSGNAYTCGYNDEKTIKALEWVYKLVNKDKVCYTPAQNSDSTTIDIMSFTDKYTVFLVSDSYAGIYEGTGYPLAVFEDGFRWIEFPKGTGFTGKTTAFYTKDDMFLALSKGTDASKSGIILNALFEPLDGDDTESWKSWLSSNYFFYPEDCELYTSMLNSAVSDGSLLTQNTNNSENDVFEKVMNGQTSAQAAVETLEPVISGLLN